MLYVVATPIGNVSDCSEHAIQVLSSVDFILAEDTRRTKRLLADLGIDAPQLISCFAHNEAKRVNRAMQELQSGKTAALVSDAGTPAVSDPGALIVAQAHKEGIKVVPVVGASSVTAAISVSGFSTPPYHFIGFPPRKKKQKRELLTEVSQLNGISVFFEAGNRVGEFIEILQELLPERELCLCRELSKTYEEIIRMKVSEFPAENVLGEVVLLLGEGDPIVSEESRTQNIKSIAVKLAEEWGISKREAYNLLMKIKPKEGR